MKKWNKGPFYTIGRLLPTAPVVSFYIKQYMFWIFSNISTTLWPGSLALSLSRSFDVSVSACLDVWVSAPVFPRVLVSLCPRVWTRNRRKTMQYNKHRHLDAIFDAILDAIVFTIVPYPGKIWHCVVASGCSSWNTNNSATEIWRSRYDGYDLDS